jgi:GGDEF domain-containing protein
LSLTAGIGIALGEHANVAELLNDADIAPYETKAAGKNRYMIFQSSM